MPRKKRGQRVGTVSPLMETGNAFPSGERIRRTTTLQAPYGSIALLCDEPFMQLIVKLNEEGGVVVDGGPRYRISERIGSTSVPKYEGHDPLRMELSVVLDGWRRGRGTPRLVTNDYRELKRLAQRNADWEMPIIRVFGPVPYDNQRWTIDGPFRFDANPPPINSEVGWYRLPLTMTLLQVVADRTLQRSTNRSRGGSGANNGPHFTKVRRGENDFGDVSKRVYKTRSNAASLARANNMPIGKRLDVGDKLRLV
jgi:hypothetical protein